jgi:hypothetical protein
MTKPKNVGIIKAPAIFLIGFDTVLAEDFTEQTGIGAAAERDVFGRLDEAKFGFESFGESSHARAAGADKSAIDVKQDQLNHGNMKAMGGGKDK